MAIFQQTLSMVLVLPSYFTSRQEEQYSFIYFVVFLLLTTIYFYLFSRDVVENIEGIDSLVNEIREGNWEITIPSHSNDEIGRLAGNINVMVQELKTARQRELLAEKAKLEMLSDLSHDLRTPMTSLRGYVELLRMNQGTQGQVAEDGAPYIDIVSRKCEQLSQQINELLEYSRLNHQENLPEKEPVDMKAVIQQVMIDFIPQMEDAGMKFTFQSSPDEFELNVDVHLIVRMLHNIVTNAITYGVSKKGIDIKLEATTNDVVICIYNYGSPIPEAELPYLFERVYRGKNGQKQDSNHVGYGLGLAIASSIATLHDGSITVQSNEEVTCFTISLPK
ncbi:putative sensor histidine kinase TcrY [compost metagenome]